MDDLPEGLLDAVKNYLDMTWSGDTDGDTKLTGIISRGISYLDGTAGHVLDYTKEEKPREILFDYCRYVRSNALEQFQINYLPELLTLQHETQIKYYAALKSLSIGSLTLAPPFAVDVFAYTSTTSNESDVVSAEANQDEAAIVIINSETEVKNGTAAVWANGENRLTVAVTYGTITKTYIVIVTKS